MHHIIISSEGYYSFVDDGIITNMEVKTKLNMSMDRFFQKSISLKTQILVLKSASVNASVST